MNNPNSTNNRSNNQKQPSSENNYQSFSKGHSMTPISNTQPQRPSNPYFQKRDQAKPQTPFIRKTEQPKMHHSTQPAPNPPQDFKPTPEQKALLLYLLQMKFMTFDQIDRKFLKSQALAQSFRTLFAYGFLKSKDEEDPHKELIVPTEKAYELVKIENPEKQVPKQIKRVFEPAVNHDLKLVELRMRFEQLNFVKKWHSERSLAEVPLMNRLFQDLPDAVCKKPNDKGYFLELEISPKARSRYEERIKHYQEVLERKEIIEQGLEGVIFLCTDEKVCETLRSLIPKTKSFSVMMLNRYLKEKEVAA